MVLQCFLANSPIYLVTLMSRRWMEMRRKRISVLGYDSDQHLNAQEKTLFFNPKRAERDKEKRKICFWLLITNDATRKHSVVEKAPPPSVPVLQLQEELHRSKIITTHHVIPHHTIPHHTPPHLLISGIAARKHSTVEKAAPPSVSSSQLEDESRVRSSLHLNASWTLVPIPEGIFLLIKSATTLRRSWKMSQDHHPT